MLDAMEKDITERFAGKEVHLEAAYTCDEETAAAWKAEIEARFPGYELVMNKLSLLYRVALILQVLAHTTFKFKFEFIKIK